MRNRREKIDESDVLTIKRLLFYGKESQTAIGRRFDISQSHVSKIANNDIYSDVPWPDGSISDPVEQPPTYGSPPPELLTPSFDEIESELYQEDLAATESDAIGEALFASMASSVEDEMNDKILADLFSIDTEAETEKPLPSTAPRLAVLPWEQILQRQPTHPMVVMTDIMSDADAVAARRILEHVFAQLPARTWYNPDVMDIIRTRWEEMNVEVNFYEENNDG